MRARESGMLEEEYWNSFFDAETAVERLLDATAVAGDLVEFGCGYGTFTLPAARHAGCTVTALDIEPEMITRVRHKAKAQGLANIRAVQRDFVALGTGLLAGTQSGVLIYNLLHLQQPVALLRETYRILRPGGSLLVIHWRSDIPRVPSLDIRPRPEHCRAWKEEAGFVQISSADLSPCCPYHYGLIAKRLFRRRSTLAMTIALPM